MSGNTQLPVSALIRQGNQLEDVEGKRRSKDEYRRQKDLEEQRKAGQAPAMVDIETGRDINPHIPEFIEKTPWYVPTGGPTLKHQRPHPEREKQMSSIQDWYQKGTTEKIAFKYRTGACENCGAMGHNKKSCFERPRCTSVKFTDKVTAADDYVLTNLKMNYDAKRDRWNGYDPADYKQVHDQFEKRKFIRAQMINENAAENFEKEELTNDEDKYADDMVPGQSVDMDSRTRITVRNLRIREDTAKYLYNLNEESAYYDPKSRSMRENPFENTVGKEKEAAMFSGENFIRYTGEVVNANEAQVFAWTARCKGIDVHALAEPTKLEALKRSYEKEKKEFKSSVTQDLVDKYGAQEHLNAPEKELLLAQTENYVEYNRKGKILKGEERLKVKSRYDEDVFLNNHTSVWGSYWKDGSWGFKCCHSLFKNSYCVGRQGILMEQYMDQTATDSLKTVKNIVDEQKVKENNDEVEFVEFTKSLKRKKLNDSEDTSLDSQSAEDIDESLSNSEEKEEVEEIEEIEDDGEEKKRRERQAMRQKTRREKRKRQKNRQKNRLSKKLKK